MKVNLTDAEVNVTLTALYERLTETKSYIRATEDVKQSETRVVTRSV